MMWDGSTIMSIVIAILLFNILIVEFMNWKDKR